MLDSNLLDRHKLEETNMINIKEISDLIPSVLRDRFERDHEIVPRLIPALGKFGQWFEHSGVPFFRTYTDHSISHSLDVFRTGCTFLPARSFEAVSVRDICYFAASCFCHDAGLHLTEIQFAQLIKNDRPPLTPFDDRSWKQMWLDFVEEAKRFSARKLIQVFGADDPVSLPPENVNDYTDRHRLLIGEFLRDNHPRLAHDLVLGLDVSIGLDPLFDSFEPSEKDIIGLMAIISFANHGDLRYIDGTGDLSRVRSQQAPLSR